MKGADVVCKHFISLHPHQHQLLPPVVFNELTYEAKLGSLITVLMIVCFKVWGCFVACGKISVFFLLLLLITSDQI